MNVPLLLDVSNEIAPEEFISMAFVFEEYPNNVLSPEFIEIEPPLFAIDNIFG